MGARDLIKLWPVYRQLTGDDRLGRGAAAESAVTRGLRPRTATADKVVKSVCPYCAVGCGQQVYVKDEKVVQIEGDPDSPISRGRLCPKGSASLQLTTGDARGHKVLYRRPHGTDWEELDLDTAMNMIADRVVATRGASFDWHDDEGTRVRRTLGVASLGGATLDNEENYLIKKLFTALGIVQVENQARVCHSSTVAGLGTSFGRGGATTFMQDLQNSDCIVIQGSNYAEAHPVGFQWVVEAKARGAKIIHVDPRFTRTSALADLYVPIRAGSDIALLGGIINHVIGTGAWFRDYVVNYTNAATIVSEDFRDTEDLDGLFSGLDAETRHYDFHSWSYEGLDVAPASGDRDSGYEARIRESGRGESHGAGGASVGEGEPRTDPTLEHPRCVFQILKRHYSRYTPEVVQEVCGITPDLFAELCESLTANSGRDRTSAFAYAVGWTQHTVGSQYIRAACILQLLLGNIGRPGGGIQALRGHASIQGSSDIPTLFDLLPGYIPMPHAHAHQDLDAFVAADAAEKGYWGNMRAYVTSLLKAWWGDAATAENDFAFDYLPKLTGSHSTYETALAQMDGVCKGYFLMGENPAVGSANAKVQRLGMANLDWLVVRDFSLIESATWWKDGPEIETGELRTEDIGTEVFFLPAAAHTEKAGSFTNTNRTLQWRHAAVEPAGEARSDLWFTYHLGRLIRERLAASGDLERDRPVLELTWDYPTEGPLDEPSAEAVLAEINGYGPDGAHLSSYEQLKDDGSTSCGCWIYCGVYADGVNQAARRKPGSEQDWIAAEWAWAWPANRRILYNRASADPDGKPWSERKALVWWDAAKGEWTGHDVPDFKADKAPDYLPPAGATGPEGISGTDPFVLQADGKGWLFAPAGLVDGPLPTHYEPQDSPFDNPLYGQSRNPVRQVFSRRENRLHPSGSEPGADVFPYVVTTYRLTEHFTAGGMTRWSPYLAELQPEFFCEISPALAAERALEHGGWATVVTARSAIECRVMVTERMTPLRVQGRTIHQIGLPYHWGPNGYTTGDAANELSAIALDPNVHIQEVKALTADIRPGRRPRGPALPELVREYQRRAGITERTGTGA
ncbi:formate dehydrogenase [Actinomadura parmotrematis]|uniref:Molybdopterin-dependent oxidoreductase n=1 Tax=Actinomadura parmotrematis TaxID=2864039 RepID=A0ABS7G325_9ACTN|nr:formate dehydrogenase [Actinomadura parmotrematis]MBW8486866.1 molybdopterin-dependent oxidoreductase [Actinomadura parmotrematis]